MDNHTPTPWHRHVTQDGDREIWAGDLHIATMAVGDGPDEEADADIIIRAVNSHAALVEALENLLNVGEYDGDGNYVIKDRGEYTETDSPDEALIPELAQALAALKLAKAPQ